MFPRSASNKPGRHGTFKDVEARLPYVSAMGFDVLYLPPIHPIGESFRKGKNNVEQADDGDVGSPWAIGSSAGGHKAIHPQLGTLEDFRRLVAAAEKVGIEIALDAAFQCSPDHPYVKEHPDWFRQRPDGTIQYAENPPKKYQDIYPFDFESKDWQNLWDELKGIFEFWIEQGVKIFRVDNPHTKPFAFWEWCIGEIKSSHPEVLFLSEAFTRPKIMYRLAKLGFTQSYTYFAWRNTKRELTEYVTALTRSETREFLRPNFWPNTPDILTEYLQLGGRPAFVSRLVLAALLSPNYGIYGPPFEHCWNASREPGSEEYLDSEKYQVHHHDLDRPGSLKDFIARVNRLRREHAALQTNQNLQFHHVDNEEIICFSKSSEDRSQIILAVVSLDPHHRQSGWVELPLEDFGLDADRPCQVHDLLSDARFLWHGRRNYVELNPEIVPAHVFQVRRRIRSEKDFEYYL
jgi:starch synthase (maltosyl-transferring)